MLIFSGFRRAGRWARQRVGAPATGTGGGVALAEAEAEAEAVDPALWHHGHHGRMGHHHHEKPEPDDAFMNYAKGTSFGVGMIHGVGAETPTQVLIFITAAGVGGKAGGVVALLAFIVGLLTSNSLITLGSAYGFLQAGRNFAVYATVGVITAVFSLVVGTIFLTGTEHILPAFFSGD